MPEMIVRLKVGQHMTGGRAKRGKEALGFAAVDITPQRTFAVRGAEIDGGAQVVGEDHRPAFYWMIRSAGTVGEDSIGDDGSEPQKSAPPSSRAYSRGISLEIRGKIPREYARDDNRLFIFCAPLLSRADRRSSGSL